MSTAKVRELLLSGVGASVDTRTLQPGEVFFALPGKNTHGAAYASEALSKGAAMVVLPQELSVELPPEKVAFHPDPLKLLSEIAHAYRQRFSLPIIAIGGSNGKTTTKALLGHILSHHARALVSPRSWNNHIGLPLTLLRLKPEHKFAVVEIGDNHPGEVRTLCAIAKPTVGLITNVGTDHLEGYGDLVTNLATKWELVECLSLTPEAIFFLNAEDELLKKQPLPSTLQTYEYGNTPKSIARGAWYRKDWEKSVIRGEVFGETFEAEIPLWGSYNRLNVLSALGIGRTLGISLSEMVAALRTFRPEAYRSQVLRRKHQVLILDAYNANPSSLSASLVALWESLSPGEKVALILGQMEELGAYTASAHRQVLLSLQEHADHILGALLVGPHWQPELSAGGHIPMEWANNLESLQKLPPWIEKADVVYVKGSRTQRLERLVEEGILPA
ncbi:MAG: UDP-N-acetylmuramoyl-tripeptide--D-alanyl-D-alanine ligase [Bacteroidia bacterium]|nr:UDP-N-acetylmuramoyl-tripeptide--D-alanyl-D-alanine ligase [Bacteroidia bacterium]MCX7652095.1 UDP-N-acetylmuramoyl-tripeptide--D-alanyl-D-alanine ligase [Bacteroidia bacterium]MDW8417122.1 UDP-N-acetylmuramoyl-tripeptide--D-alanyl-D-alanine ligase [Bacteroidia bacterium]